MRLRQVAWTGLVALTAAGLAGCGGNDLEDEMDDVIEEQQEAAERAVETPEDTAAIRREGQDVEQEQREVKEAMRNELKDKGLTSSN